MKTNTQHRNVNSLYIGSLSNATWSLEVKERSNSKTLENELNLFEAKNIACLFSGPEGRSCVESLPIIFVISCILPLQMQVALRKRCNVFEQS